MRGVGAEPPGQRNEDRADVTAVVGGDVSAWGRLYARYAPLVHGVLLARLSAADADELVQDVFATALQRLETLPDPDAVGGWLVVMARNRALDHLRRSPRVEEPPVEDAADDPTRVEARQALRYIRALPDVYRELLVLRLVEGMTGPEIAERTGTSPVSVRLKLQQGMSQLRALMGGDEVEPDER